MYTKITVCRQLSQTVILGFYIGVIKMGRMKFIYAISILAAFIIAGLLVSFVNSLF
jgi:hypothetical protein